VLAPQSISRHHASIQISEQAAANANAVAILRDSSFNGCFVGDDLVRNRAEWLGAGDVIRFGNDKEKFVLETITMNEAAMNNGGGREQGMAQQQQHQQTQQQHQQPQQQYQQQPLSPIDESNQHGGKIAGMGSEHGERLRASDGLKTSPIRQYQSTQPMQQSQPLPMQQQQQGARTGGGQAPWASMAAPPMPSAPMVQQRDVSSSNNVVRTNAGQAWQIR